MDIGNRMKRELSAGLEALGVRFERQDDVFFVYRDSGELPFGTFVVSPLDCRLSLVTAFPFEVEAGSIRDTLIAINALNDVLPSGRLYLSVNGKGNAVFFDQYLLSADGGVLMDDIKFMLASDAEINELHGRWLFQLANGGLTVKEFMRRIRL